MVSKQKTPWLFVNVKSRRRYYLFHVFGSAPPPDSGGMTLESRVNIDNEGDIDSCPCPPGTPPRVHVYLIGRYIFASPPIDLFWVFNCDDM